MNDIDMFISNGTCYYETGKESSKNVIPCGNAANDVYPCCQAGDFCLEYNVCYNENCKSIIWRPESCKTHRTLKR